MCLSSEPGTSKAPRRRKPFNVVSSGLRENCKAHCKALSWKKFAASQMAKPVATYRIHVWYICLPRFTINQPNVGKYHTWTLWAYGLILGSSWVLGRSSLGCSEGHRLSTARHHLAKWCQWLLLAARSQNEGPCFFAILPKDCWASTEAIDTGHRRRSLGKEIARFKVEIPQKVTVSTCEANENEWKGIQHILGLGLVSLDEKHHFFIHSVLSPKLPTGGPSAELRQTEPILKETILFPTSFQPPSGHLMTDNILPDRFWLTWTWCSKPLQLLPHGIARQAEDIPDLSCVHRVHR